MKEILNTKNNNDNIINCPLTCGNARFSLKMKGEKILKCTVHLGFNHKGFEKAANNKAFAQYLPLAKKIDFLSGFFYSQAYISAIEELLGLEIPKNAQYTRVLTMELNRISSHLWWLGCFTEDLGSKTASQHAFQLRGEITELLQKITGGQKPYQYYAFGGVNTAISDDILNNILNFTDNFNKKLKIFDKLLTKNPIFIDRTRNTGILTSEIALPYSITGVNLRANGIPLDFRKEKPYLIYNELEFSIPTAFEGDCYSRYILRIKEAEVSLSLVKQCAERLLANNDDYINLDVNQNKIQPEAKKAVSYTESPRGLVICSVTADGSKKPKRVKWRTPSFYSLQLLENMAAGYILSDFKTLCGSLDISLSEAER